MILTARRGRGGRRRAIPTTMRTAAKKMQVIYVDLIVVVTMAWHTLIVERAKCVTMSMSTVGRFYRCVAEAVKKLWEVQFRFFPVGRIK